jgi:hypothetical protein
MQKNAFEDSVLKDVSRYLVRRRVLDQFPVEGGLNAFTLPGTSFAFEEDLHKDYGVALRLRGIEEKKAIYEAACAKLDILPTHLNMEVIHGHDLSYWGCPSYYPYDFIWLDYCGSWGPDKEEAFRLILKNGHVSFERGNPLIALTVCAAREFGDRADDLLEETKLSRLLKGKSADDENAMADARRIGIPRILNRRARKLGYSLVPQFTAIYRDAVRNKLATTMLLFMFEACEGKVPYNEGKVPHTDMRAWLSKDLH